jgi:hypothetical protein
MFWFISAGKSVISKKSANLPFAGAERKGERDACGLHLAFAAKSAKK